MKNTLTLAFVILVSGCTNHLYSGTTSYEFNGKTCHSMVYWNDLTHLFDQDGKATTIVVKAPGGRSYSLTPTDAPVAQADYELILPSSDFVDSINATTDDTELLCGKFEGKEQHQQNKAPTTSFFLYCDKKAHPLRKSTDVMKASSSPYIFAMNEPIEAFSWFKAEEIQADISSVKCE